MPSSRVNAAAPNPAKRAGPVEQVTIVRAYGRTGVSSERDMFTRLTKTVSGNSHLRYQCRVPQRILLSQTPSTKKGAPLNRSKGSPT